MDPKEPVELEEILQTLPARHQTAIRAAWQNLRDRSLENQRLLRRMLRIVRGWLLALSIVLGGMGYWSIKLTRDQTHAQYQARFDRCVATNQAHDRSIAYVDDLFAKVGKRVPASQRAQLEQSRKYDDRLLDLAFPYVRDCSRVASGQTPMRSTSTTTSSSSSTIR